MITLTQLAEQLTEGLNAELKAFVDAKKECNECTPLDTPRGRYQFIVRADTSEYKKPTREGNTVTYYIHGTLMLAGSDLETTAGDAKTSATMETSMHILVPVTPFLVEEEGNIMVQQVREVLDGYLYSNRYTTMTDSAENNYSVGIDYSLGSTGSRSQLPGVGDCFSFYSGITYYFLQDGVNSRKYTVTIDDEQVPYVQLGFRRGSDQEANVDSDKHDGASKAVTAATVFTMNFNAPTQNSALFDMINLDYLLNGAVNPHTVRIGYTKSNGDTVTIAKKMVFNEATLNLQTIANASTTVEMVEYMGVD